MGDGGDRERREWEKEGERWNERDRDREWEGGVRVESINFFCAPRFLNLLLKQAKVCFGRRFKNH